MIEYDPGECCRWLNSGAARLGGIDSHEFSVEFGTVAKGVEWLLFQLMDGSQPQVWRAQAPLGQVTIWPTADDDGPDGGGIITADIRLGDVTLRLATLHHSVDELLDDPEATGINAAVQALSVVAAAVNREAANALRLHTTDAASVPSGAAHPPVSPFTPHSFAFDPGHLRQVARLRLQLRRWTTMMQPPHTDNDTASTSAPTHDQHTNTAEQICRTLATLLLRPGSSVASTPPPVNNSSWH